MSTNIQKNSFLYGELNTQLKNNQYTGGETSTAIVHVDTTTNKILVDAKIDVSQVQAQVEKINAEFILAQNRITELNKTLTETKQQLEKADQKLASDLVKTKDQLIREINQVKIEIQEIIQPKLDELAAQIEEVKEELVTKVDSLGLQAVDGMLCVVYEGEETE